MTHAESRDLLLDLAYGELDDARAAEVRAHVDGCAECRRERDAIEETRALVQPLRAVEEPSAAFDARILAAARLEASHQSDGLPGEVIEAKASVQPMGVQAARIDAASARVRAAERRKPRWAVRLAIAGSGVAAAALVFLVVRPNEPARQTYADGDYQVRVAPASVDEAKRAAEQNAANAPQADARAAAPAAAPAEPPPALAVGPRAMHRERGAGGDVPAVRDEAAPEKSRADAAPAAARTAPATKPAPAAKAKPSSEAPAAAPPPAQAENAAPAAADSGLLAHGQAPAAAARKSAARAESTTNDVAVGEAGAGTLEAQAQAARRAGNYTGAAALYRKAAGLRTDDAPTAAWNLAHAVECLAAAGSVDEARSVRAELRSRYPGETAAFAAARRALREFGPADSQ